MNTQICAKVCSKLNSNFTVFSGSEMVTNKELIEKLKKEKFDAYFGEQIHLCGMGLAHLIGIKHRFWIARYWFWFFKLKRTLRFSVAQ